MNAHSTRFGLNLVFGGSVAQTVEEAKRAAGVGFGVVLVGVAAAADLADQSQALGMWEERLPDQLIDHSRSVVLGGVDAVDATVDGPAIPQALHAVSGLATVAGCQLHGAVPVARRYQ
jgi:hypothetical protein